MSGPVEIVRFPKLCPRCGYGMRTVVKVGYTWLECRDLTCPAYDGDEDRGYTCARAMTTK